MSPRIYCLYVNGPSPSVSFADSEFHYSHFLGKPESGEWVVPKVRVCERRKPLKDMVMGYGTAPFVSERFKQVMSPVVGRHVEFLPLTVLGKTPFFVLNVVEVVDCLDVKGSDVLYASDEPGKILHIGKFVFDPEKVKTVPVFKVPQDAGNIFVTGAFLEAARVGKLSGIGVDYPQDIRLVKGPSPAVGFPT